MPALSKENIRFLPPAAKYLIKLKDKRLKDLFHKAVDDILQNPFIGEEKTGDLKGIRCVDIHYSKVNYELAYTITYKESNNTCEPEMIIVIMTGTRENFYNELKRYIK